MIVIYGAYRSRATRNYWLCNEIGLEVAAKPILQAYRIADPLGRDAPLNTLSPALLAISPAGAIPVMDDDGFILTESLAINLYLARTYGGDLGPRDGKEDALMQQWALYGAISIEPAALAIMTAMNHDIGSKDAEFEMNDRVEALQRPLKVIEARIATEGHPVGGRFTVADINLAEVLRYAQSHTTLVGSFPAINAWLTACQARPAYQAMWAKRLAEPV